MGIEQTLDDKTGKLLSCRTIMAEMRKRTIVKAKEKEEKGTEEEKGPNDKEKKIDTTNKNKKTYTPKNPNEPLFSPESLKKYHVPGYEVETTANLGEVEETDR